MRTSPSDSRMPSFRYMHGAVYVLENLPAQRVKVGMTTGRVVDRLNDVNDMWQGRKVTCQICGGRVVSDGWFVPPHVKNGRTCPGGDALPLEPDASLAEAYLTDMRNGFGELSGSAKGSATRIMSHLAERIERYRNQGASAGTWRIAAVYYTECAEQVELLSHELLAQQLDWSAPFGEVFRCAVPVASAAIESVLDRLGLLTSARSETEYGAA